jgi:hypothetical protein
MKPLNADTAENGSKKNKSLFKKEREIKFLKKISIFWKNLKKK